MASGFAEIAEVLEGGGVGGEDAEFVAGGQGTQRPRRTQHGYGTLLELRVDQVFAHGHAACAAGQA